LYNYYKDKLIFNNWGAITYELDKVSYYGAKSFSD